jgi:hypothetical protein
MNDLFDARAPRRHFHDAGRIVRHMAMSGLLAGAFVAGLVGTPARAETASTAAVTVPAPASTAVTATPSTAPASPFGPAFVQVAESTLDGLRGGFTTDAGVQVSFGIERTVLVNGNVVSATSFNLAAGGSAGPALVSSAGIGSGASLLTAVQNSANGQKIQTLTTVNVTANSLQVLKAGNLQALVGGGLTASLQR